MSLKPFEEKPDEIVFFEHKKTDKIYVSRRLEERETKEAARIASKVIDGSENHQFFKEIGEIVLKVSEGERSEIKAIFYEDSKKIKTFTIQRFTRRDGKPHRSSFTFSGDEIIKLIEFVKCIVNIPLNTINKFQIDDSALKDLIITREQALKLYNENKPIFQELFEAEISISDILAIKHKKEQLLYFEKLLNDDSFFNNERELVKGNSSEKVWQNFFEKNPWILGYGLNYIFNTPLEDKKLEQVVKGADIFSAGKRIDGLSKTRGIINSLCFCEIKTHKTELLKKVQSSYRSESWAISTELAGGIAQIQKTIQKSIENIKTKTQIDDEQGNLTGEEVFLYHPKSCLIVGSLDEFKGTHGVNEDKFSSFEIFRKHITNPEIITFDELFERAKFIIDIAEHTENEISDDIPELDDFPF